jgi:prevent-host-death family protein
MQHSWQLQEAKNRFSEVVEEALQHGPQTVTRHGRETVVILAYAEYLKLKPAQPNMLTALQIPQEYRVDLTIERSQELTRNIEL